MAANVIADTMVRCRHFLAKNDSKKLKFAIRQEGVARADPVPALNIIGDPIWLQGSASNDILHPFQGVQIQFEIVDDIGLGKKLVGAGKGDFVLLIQDPNETFSGGFPDGRVLATLGIYAPVVKTEIFSRSPVLKLIATNGYGSLKDQNYPKGSSTQTIGQALSKIFEKALGDNGPVAIYTDWQSDDVAPLRLADQISLDTAWLSRGTENESNITYWEAAASLLSQFNLQAFYDLNDEGHFPPLFDADTPHFDTTKVMERRSRLSAPVSLSGTTHIGGEVTAPIKKALTSDNVFAYPLQDYKDGIKKVITTDHLSDGFMINSSLSARQIGPARELKGWAIEDERPAGDGGVLFWHTGPIQFIRDYPDFGIQPRVVQKSSQVISEEDLVAIAIDARIGNRSASAGDTFTYMVVDFVTTDGATHYLKNDLTWTRRKLTDALKFQIAVDGSNGSNFPNLTEVFEFHPPAGVTGCLKVLYGIQDATDRVWNTLRNFALSLNIGEANRKSRSWSFETDASVPAKGTRQYHNHVYSNGADGNVYAFKSGTDKVAIIRAEDFEGDFHKQSTQDKIQQYHGQVRRYRIEGLRYDLRKPYWTYQLGIDGEAVNLLPLEYRWNMRTGKVQMVCVEGKNDATAVEAAKVYADQNDRGSTTGDGGTTGRSGNANASIGKYLANIEALADAPLVVTSPGLNSNFRYTLKHSSKFEIANNGLDLPQGIRATDSPTFAGMDLTGKLDMGSSLITGLADPVEIHHAATKGYVDAVISGLDWQESVLAMQSAPPGNPSVGDRYVVSGSGELAWAGNGGNIAVYKGGSVWEFIPPNEGTALEEERSGYVYIYNGTIWARFGSAISHAQLQDLTTGDPHPQYVSTTLGRTITALHTFGSGAIFGGGVTGTSAALSSVLSVAGLASLDGGIAVGSKFTVERATGNMATAGTLTVTGLVTVHDDIYPATNHTSNLGSASKKFFTAHVAELRAETIIADERRSTIGGRLNVGLGNILTRDIGPVGSLIHVKVNNLNRGDVIHLERDGQVEFMSITAYIASLGRGQDLEFRYRVSRNLDGTGSNTWLKGDGIINTGKIGTGFIDLYSTNSLKHGISTAGPTIAFMQRTGSGFGAVSIRACIGNLRGWYGYGQDVYGAGFGDELKDNVTIDPANGFRLRHGVSTLLQANAQVLKIGTGFVYSADNTTLKVGGWTANPESFTGGSLQLLPAGKIWHTAGLWSLNNDGSGRLAGGNITWDKDGSYRLGNAANYVQFFAEKGDLTVRANAFNLTAGSLLIDSGIGAQTGYIPRNITDEFFENSDFAENSLANNQNLLPVGQPGWRWSRIGNSTVRWSAGAADFRIKPFANSRLVLAQDKNNIQSLRGKTLTFTANVGSIAPNQGFTHWHVGDLCLQIFGFKQGGDRVLLAEKRTSPTDVQSQGTDISVSATIDAGLESLRFAIIYKEGGASTAQGTQIIKIRYAKIESYDKTQVTLNGSGLTIFKSPINFFKADAKQGLAMRGVSVQTHDLQLTRTSAADSGFIKTPEQDYATIAVRVVSGVIRLYIKLDDGTVKYVIVNR